MAIEKLEIPSPTSMGAIEDYQAILTQLIANAQAFTLARVVDGSSIPAGRIILIGGVLFMATSATSITGAASSYVKVTPSGDTASASFVASLSGVSWNDAYGGYYDGSGNLYLFDEASALLAGVISVVKTEPGKKLTTTDAVAQLNAVGIYRANSTHGFFSSTTNGNFTVPAGVYEIWVYLIGGGGGGAGGGNTSSQPGGAGGSGASCFVRMSVVPGQVIAFDVRGGAFGTGYFANGNDGVGSFGAVVAGAGGIGGGCSNNNGGAPGIGGVGGAETVGSGPHSNGNSGTNGTAALGSGLGGGIGGAAKTITVQGIIPVSAGKGGNGAPWAPAGNQVGVAGDNGYLGIVY